MERLHDISTVEMVDYSKILARQIEKNSIPDAIVGVSRGGLLPASIIARVLDVPLYCATHTDKGVFIERGSDLVGKNVVVVDDTFRTGTRLFPVLQEAEKVASSVRSAVVFVAVQHNAEEPNLPAVRLHDLFTVRKWFEEVTWPIYLV